MVRLVYSFLVALCIPFVLLKLWFRGFKAPEYRTRRLERLGFFRAPTQAQDIWVHAVSVGELLAAEPIIRELQRRYPDKRVAVTTMTPTSSALLDKLFGDSVFHVYAPYDLPLFVNAFLRRIQPKFVIIMETELWPNMIHGARKHGCPVVLANARLSERSARGYRKALPMVGWLLGELHQVLCQFEPDAERFASLGIPPSRIKVTGSVKFDIELESSVTSRGESLREKLDEDSRVWVAASTHEGEDAKMLAVHAELKKSYPKLILVLVPRHPERFESAYELALGKGFRVGRYSDAPSISANQDVFVLDTMGKLMDFYAACDMVFIGGSFTEIGGHNPIEPAVLGKPMFIGPHYFNFEMICQAFVESGALEVVQNEADLKSSLVVLLNDQTLCRERGEKAYAVVERGKGAIARVVDEVAYSIEQQGA